MDEKYSVHSTSFVDDDVENGEGTKIWYFSLIQSDTRIGKNCCLGKNLSVLSNGKVEDECKAQNNTGCCRVGKLKDYMLYGLFCFIINSFTTRAKYPNGHASYKKTIIYHDATVGANCIIVCGYEIKEYITIVVVEIVVSKDVQPYALTTVLQVKRNGGICECRKMFDAQLICPDYGRRYGMRDNFVTMRGSYYRRSNAGQKDVWFSKGRVA